MTKQTSNVFKKIFSCDLVFVGRVEEEMQWGKKHRDKIKKQTK